MSLEIKELWKQIDTGADNRDGWHSRRILKDSSVKIYAAIEKPVKTPAILLEINASSISRVIEYPECTGFFITQEIIQPGPHGIIRICLRLKDQNYYDVFAILAEDVALIVAQSSNEIEAINNFVSRLRIWQGFFTRNKDGRLSREEVIGLFSELSFLGIILGRLPVSTALAVWTGPDQSEHDFKLLNNSIEIKGTTSTGELIKISSIEQLDDTRVNTLLLVQYILGRTGENAKNLPELIDETKSQIIASDPSALDNFNTKLIQSGYIDLQKNLYLIEKYNINKTRWYKVTGNFPRIRRVDVINGIEDVKYVIRASECNDYAISADFIEPTISEMTNG